MKIDLRQIPIYVISTAGSERHKFVTEQLASVGLQAELVEAIQCWPGIIGCGLSHMKALKKAICLPALVLEDDCAVTADFSLTITIPREASAVYLGMSNWGVRPTDCRAALGNVDVKPWFGGAWLQISGMCSSHAILYLKRRYLDTAWERIASCVSNDIPFDLSLAHLQRFHTVLTPNRPFFYQSALVGGNEADTRNPLIPVSQDVLAS